MLSKALDVYRIFFIFLTIITENRKKNRNKNKIDTDRTNNPIEKVREKLT